MLESEGVKMKCYNTKCKKQGKNKFKIVSDQPKGKMELEGKFCEDHIADVIKCDIMPMLESMLKRKKNR
jgi:hypothetical protein